MKQKLIVETTVRGSIQQIWDLYTKPEHIVHWNFVTDDWRCPTAENDLRIGGKQKIRMEAKDGSFGFDFEVTYHQLEPLKRIGYFVGESREVIIDFSGDKHKTHIKILFDAGDNNSIEIQQKGWQSILDNFKKYVESKKNG